MSRPYWLTDDGRPVDDGVPYSQQVRDYYRHLSLERMRSFRAELHHHGDAATAKACLGFGGCIAPTSLFRDDLAKSFGSADRFASSPVTDHPDCVYDVINSFEPHLRGDLCGVLDVQAVAAPVTPPLSPMGGTHTPKLIKKAADQWAKNHAY